MIPVIIIISNKYIRIFRRNKAISPESAIEPGKYGIGKNRAITRLVRQGIVINNGNGYYYLDETREKEVRKHRQTILSWCMIILVVISFIIFLTSFKR